MILFEALGAHVAERLVPEEALALDTHQITGLLGNLGLLFHIHHFNYNVFPTVVKAQ